MTGKKRAIEARTPNSRETNVKAGHAQTSTQTRAHEYAINANRTDDSGSFVFGCIASALNCAVFVCARSIRRTQDTVNCSPHSFCSVLMAFLVVSGFSCSTYVRRFHRFMPLYPPPPCPSAQFDSCYLHPLPPFLAHPAHPSTRVTLLPCPHPSTFVRLHLCHPSEAETRAIHERLPIDMEAVE